MFGDSFRSGRRLPVLILVLLLVIAAGIYIRFQFGRVEHELTTPNSTAVMTAASTPTLITPVPVNAEPVRRAAEAGEHALDAASAPQPGGVQPDRPIEPDAPLPK